jgi:hypothetical protein
MSWTTVSFGVVWLCEGFTDDLNINFVAMVFISKSNPAVSNPALRRGFRIFRSGRVGCGSLSICLSGFEITGFDMSDFD